MSHTEAEIILPNYPIQENFIRIVQLEAIIASSIQEEATTFQYRFISVILKQPSLHQTRPRDECFSASRLRV